MLLAAGLYQDAISRAYYAAFPWARALLVSRGLEPTSHRGTIQLLGLHFVKDGPLSKESAGLLAHLETWRELCDDNPDARFSEDQAAEEVARAERFIEAVTPLVPTG